MAQMVQTLMALGLAALCRALTLAAADSDATVLVQLSRVHGQDMDDGNVDNDKELWFVEGGLPTDITPYAFERFEAGATVEGRSKDGSWLPVIVAGRAEGNLYNIHVADEFPGYDLPNVPPQLLRRELQPGQSDWLMDNTWLHHKGSGINYRVSKGSDSVKSAEFAPWGTLVVGSEEDGWLKTANGYLPMELNGVPIVLQKERENPVMPMPAEYQQSWRQGQNHSHNETLPTPAPVQYEVGEHIEFKTRKGDWYEARVVSKSVFPNAYNVIVQASEYAVHPVLNVHYTRLRKPGPPGFSKQSGESPMCQNDGCILIRARNPLSGELLFHLSKNMKIEMLMKMACNKLKMAWEKCKERVSVVHNGESLPADLHIQESGLEDMEVVQIKLGH